MYNYIFYINGSLFNKYIESKQKKEKIQTWKKIKITQITHNWDLNLSLISYKSSFKIIPDFHKFSHFSSVQCFSKKKKTTSWFIHSKLYIYNMLWLCNFKWYNMIETWIIASWLHRNRLPKCPKYAIMIKKKSRELLTY